MFSVGHAGTTDAEQQSQEFDFLTLVNCCDHLDRSFKVDPHLYGQWPEWSFLCQM